MSNGRIHAIIHSASTAAAGAGAGLAQIPGSDSVAIVPIQLAMINGIAIEHGCRIDKAAAMSIIATQGATMVGRKVSQFLVGWIPGFGNALTAKNSLNPSILLNAMVNLRHVSFIPFSS